MASHTHFRRFGASLVLAAVLFGCRGKQAEVLQTRATIEPPYVPQSGSANAFDGYALAAQQAEQDAPKYLLTTYFTPGFKRYAIQKTTKALGMLRQASTKECTFEFRPRKPFETPPYQKGWRLLGRALVWSIQGAIQKGDYDTAVSDTIVAHKFGFDLTGGSAIDASLGFAVANDARRAISPFLEKLGAGQLGRLSEGIRGALRSKPLLDRVMKHEEKNMLLAVQEVQDAHSGNRWESLEEGLGRDAVEGAKNLRTYIEENSIAEYFDGFAREAQEEAQWISKVSRLSARQRANVPDHRAKTGRPWALFAKHFCEIGRPLLPLNDATLARTRLLALNARLLQMAKAVKSVPSTLDQLPEAITRDPYSGGRFVYETTGLDFNVYSVGANFQDDGGETDESFSDPDLTLEK